MKEIIAPGHTEKEVYALLNPMLDRYLGDRGDCEYLEMFNSFPYHLEIYLRVGGGKFISKYGLTFTPDGEHYCVFRLYKSQDDGQMSLYAAWRLNISSPPGVYSDEVNRLEHYFGLIMDKMFNGESSKYAYSYPHDKLRGAEYL